MLTRSIRPAAGPANRPPSTHRPWDTELLVLRGESRERLKAAVQATADDLRRHPETDLTDLAFTLNSDLHPGGSRLALVAATAADAVTRLERALQRLEDPRCTADPRCVRPVLHRASRSVPAESSPSCSRARGPSTSGCSGMSAEPSRRWRPSSPNATRSAGTQVTSARLSRRSSSRPTMPGPTTSPTPRRSCAGSTTPCSA